MFDLRKLAGPAWLAAGLAAGLLVGSLLPHTPLHAVATDRLENFAIATGYQTRVCLLQRTPPVAGVQPIGRQHGMNVRLLFRQQREQKMRYQHTAVP